MYRKFLCVLSVFFVILILTVAHAQAAWTPETMESGTVPSDAILLFGKAADGTLVNRFLSKEGTPADWKVENDVLISTSRPVDAQNPPRSSHIFSDETFRDADIHVEFQVAEASGGNSGIYIHGNYEIQIMNSAGASTLDRNVTGALYGINPPRVNASRPVGEWQVCDIHYQAPRRNEKGEIIQNGRLTAWLNGQLVQDDTEFGEPVSNYHPYRYGETPFLRDLWAKQIQTGFGPLFLQDHGSPARFRNVWIRKN